MHNTQHTTHNTQHTAHSTQHNIHNTQHNTHNTARNTHRGDKGPGRGLGGRSWQRSQVGCTQQGPLFPPGLCHLWTQGHTGGGESKAKARRQVKTKQKTCVREATAVEAQAPKQCVLTLNACQNKIPLVSSHSCQEARCGTLLCL